MMDRGRRDDDRGRAYHDDRGHGSGRHGQPQAAGRGYAPQPQCQQRRHQSRRSRSRDRREGMDRGRGYHYEDRDRGRSDPLQARSVDRGQCDDRDRRGDGGWAWGPRSTNDGRRRQVESRYDSQAFKHQSSSAAMVQQQQYYDQQQHHHQHDQGGNQRQGGYGVSAHARSVLLLTARARFAERHTCGPC